MITPALWCYLTSSCLDCQATTPAHRSICEQDSGSFRSAPRSQTQTHHNHHNASTPSINERITFHMSTIKQINQYWFSQLNFFFVAIECSECCNLPGRAGLVLGMVVGRRRRRTRGSTSSGAGTSRQLQKITDRDDCDKRDERWARTQISAASQ